MAIKARREGKRGPQYPEKITAKGRKRYACTQGLQAGRWRGPGLRAVWKEFRTGKWEIIQKIRQKIIHGQVERQGKD